MRFFHYLPMMAAVAAGIALLAGAGQRRDTPNTPTCPFTPPPPAVADRAASQTLDAALAALEKRRNAWLETTVRQKVRLPDLEYDAEGRFQAAPNNRFRLELQTRSGPTKETLLTVGDGTNVWRASRVDDGAWTEVHRAGMKQVPDDLAAGPQTRDALFHGSVFRGPEPLLHNLRRSMVWVKRAPVMQAGTQILELTGVWPETLSAALAPNGKSWPQGMPDRCRLLLRADTLWPRRIEWWGPTTSGTGLVRLVQMELRDPVLNHALSARECARVFTFNPGKAPVSHEITTVKEGLAGTASR
jgi:hypothetical protein